MLKVLKHKLVMFKGDYFIFLVMIGMSLLLTFVFTLAFGENSKYRPQIAYIDNSGDEASKNMIDDIIKQDIYNLVEMELEEAVNKLENSQIKGIMLIEEDFENKLQNNEISIRIYKYNESVEIINFKNTLETYLREYLNDKLTVEIISSEISNIASFDISEIGDFTKNTLKEERQDKSVLKIISNVVSNNPLDNFNSVKHYALGFAIMFSTYTIVFSMGDIIKEKRNGTWNRQLVTSLSETGLITGNMAFAFLQGFVHLSVTFIAGKFLFGINWGDINIIISMLIVTASFVLAMVGLGMFLSNIVKTMEQLSAVTPLILTAFAMLGGCMWPLEIISSKLMLVLADITPHRWAMSAIEGISMYDKTLSSIIQPVLVLLFMALIYTVLSIILTKKISKKAI